MVLELLCVFIYFLFRLERVIFVDDWFYSLYIDIFNFFFGGKFYFEVLGIVYVNIRVINLRIIKSYYWFSFIVFLFLNFDFDN